MKPLHRLLALATIPLLCAASASCTGMMACSIRGTCGLPDGEFGTTGRTETILEKTAGRSIDVEFPVSGLPQIDTRLRALIDAEIESFRSRPQGNASPDRPNDMLIIRFDVPDAPADVYSVVFHSYIYTGGAHGMTHVITRNYDIKTGQILTLDDLFRPRAEYLPLLSEIAVEDLIARLGSQSDPGWVRRGAGPSKENYARFTITRDALIFHFEPYAVAPYAAGVQTVSVPKTQIAPYLRSS